MAGNKYLKVGTTGAPFAEQAATQVSAGAGNANEIVALDATGKLDLSLFPAGIGLNVDVYTASENLSAGDFVNVWDDAGTTKVRKADGSNGRRAHAFVKVAVTSGNPATVYGPGELNDQVTTAAGGAQAYLSVTVPGGFQTSLAVTATHIIQSLGVTGTNTIRFCPADPIVRA